MENTKMLFFRTVADDNNNDGIDDSVCLPASRLVSISPTSDTEVTMYFESAKLNTQINQENISMDSVALNVTQGDTFEVCKDLISLINSNPHSDGFIVIADDMTTTDSATSALADLTVSAKYAHPSIGSCGNITIGTAQYMRLPEMEWGAASTAISNGLTLAVNTNYHSIATVVTAALPSAAAGKAGDWITVKYTTVVNDGVVHTYNTTTDATFVAGSTITRIGGGVASGIDVCDGSAKNTLVIDGDTNGAGGIGSYIRFVNTTGDTDGWMAQAIVLNQGNGSAAMAAATTFPA